MFGPMPLPTPSGMPTFPDEITVTAPDPGGVTNVTNTPTFDIGGPDLGAGGPFDYPYVGPRERPGPINAVTQPGNAVFGEAAEAERQNKILNLLRKLLKAGLGVPSALSMIASMLGGGGYEGVLGLPPLGENETPFLGVPTLPQWNPGATRGGSFLDWQPNNPLSSPSRMVDYDIYRPDLVEPPGQQLLAALLPRLLAGLGGGGGGGGLGGGGLGGGGGGVPNLASILGPGGGFGTSGGFPRNNLERLMF